jgi:hypothetical protein
VDDRIDALHRLPQRAGVVEVAAHGGRAGQERHVASDEGAAVKAGPDKARQQAWPDQAGRPSE